MTPSFILPLAPFINKLVSSLTLAYNVRNIKFSDSCAFSPLAEAVIRATGFSEKTTVDTVHSMAFFKIPGKLKTYSGVQISTPLAESIFCLNSLTTGEIMASSVSGLK